jgi:2'-5' RNA ligase
MSDKSTWIGFRVRFSEPLASYIPVDDPHITIAHLGKEVSDKQIPDLMLLLIEWLRFGSKEISNFNGPYEAFTKEWNQFGKSFLVALCDLPFNLERDYLLNTLNRSGYQVASDYKFNPHITVAHEGHTRVHWPEHPIKFWITHLFIEHKGNKILDMQL